MSKIGFTSKILHSDRLSSETRIGAPEHGALHRPIHANIAFGYQKTQDLVDVFQGKQAGFAYGRQSNPTVEALENKVALMEEASQVICFSTGMAAIGALTQSLLNSGDHFVSSQFLFGNTNSQFETAKRLGIDVSLVDATNVKNVEEVLRPETKFVFVETIANPMTQVADLKKIGELCKAKGILYIVDNTMTTPVMFLPKTVGAGLIIHSLSKYIGGHGNALGGAIVSTGLFDWSTYGNILDIYKKGESTTWGMIQIKKKSLRDFGGTLSPEAANSISMGADTLSLRVNRACDNAEKLSAFLNSHPNVGSVHYPGLNSHPEHELSEELFCRNGALFTFVPKDTHHCFDVLDKMDLIVSSSNLGDNRTLAIPVAHTIFFEMGVEKRKAMGIPENAIRVSVGIEDIDDLIKSFDEALS